MNSVVLWIPIIFFLSCREVATKKTQYNASFTPDDTILINGKKHNFSPLKKEEIRSLQKKSQDGDWSVLCNWDYDNQDPGRRRLRRIIF